MEGLSSLVCDTKKTKQVRLFQEPVVFDVKLLQNTAAERQAVNRTSSCSAVCVDRCLAVAKDVKQSLRNVFFTSCSILNIVWL